MKILLLLLLAFSIAQAAPKPKYGPEAVTLSRSHEFFRKAPAPDFWALAPYYVGQRDDRSCSVASVTMVMNALRSKLPLTADDELITQDSLLKKVGSGDWWKDRGAGGVTLDQLGKAIEQSLAGYELAGLEVEVVHADKTPEFRARLHEALVANEKSDADFIILNFIQGAYTGDADVGHIAPLGAYDGKRALVMDPDRKWYEPYWVSEETLLNGMATHDPQSGGNRGFAWIHPAGNPAGKTIRKVEPRPSSL
jgi:hypothetical protein